MNEPTFRMVTVVLLAVICAILALIWLRMPPSFGEIRSEQDKEKKKELMMKRPAVHVSGDVSATIEP